MRAFFCRRAGLVAWSCGVLFAMTGHATTVTSAQIQEVAQITGQPSVSFDSGQLNQNVLTHQINLTFVDTSGTINGNDITALASAQNGQAFFDGFWTDGITVGGLPAGTPVSLLITNSLTSNVSINGTGHASATSDLRLFVGSPIDLTLCNSVATDGGAPCAADNGTQTASQIVTLISGNTAPLIIEEHVALRALVNGVEAQADAPNDILISVLTPGGTFTSASGVSYAATAAVPEPATTVPMLIVLAALLFAASRNRRTGWGGVRVLLPLVLAVVCAHAQSPKLTGPQQRFCDILENWETRGGYAPGAAPKVDPNPIKAAQAPKPAGPGNLFDQLAEVFGPSGTITDWKGTIAFGVNGKIVHVSINPFCGYEPYAPISPATPRHMKTTFVYFASESAHELPLQSAPAQFLATTKNGDMVTFSGHLFYEAPTQFYREGVPIPGGPRKGMSLQSGSSSQQYVHGRHPLIIEVTGLAK